MERSLSTGDRSGRRRGRDATWPGVVLCTLVAVAYRVWLLATLHDVPGDGPSRAAIAIAWATAPELPTCGSWPPGHTLLAGLFHLLLPSPPWSARVLNVVLGTLSVPLLYAVCARTWADRRVALVAAAALALLPLHAELSATSLTEVPFACALLAAWWMLLVAVPAEARGDGHGQRAELGVARAAGHTRGAAVAGRHVVHGAALLAAGGALTLAQMLRYEGWAFAPVVLAWWLWRTRATRATALLAVLVLWFPIAWTLGNARCGDPWLGFHAALGESAVWTGGGPVARAVFVARVVRAELGGFAVLAVLAGAAREIAMLLRGRSSGARLLALLLAGTAWATLVASVAARGSSVWTRYFLPPLVLVLPFAAASLQLVRGGVRVRRVVTVLVVAGLLLGLAVPDLAGRRPRHWLRPDPPRAAADLAAWLAADPARGRLPLLATPVGWELTFLPLLAPDTYWRLRTCSAWTAEPELVRWIDDLRGAGPFLVVTRADDEPHLARIERVAGAPLRPGEPVLRADGLEVYVAELPARAD